jgi:Fe-S cluster biogenesis protein NfuA
VSGEQVTIEEIEAVLDRDVRPALSAHAGSIEVASSADGRVELRMTRSCGSCYFRRSCQRILVEPALEDRFGDRLEVLIGR